MLIQHIAESREGGLDAATDEDVSDLQALYKASKKRFDAEEDFKARARGVLDDEALAGGGVPIIAPNPPQFPRPPRCQRQNNRPSNEAS